MSEDKNLNTLHPAKIVNFLFYVIRLFLACGNLGITIGTSVGGLFIAGMGTQYVVLGGVLFLILSVGSILLTRLLQKPCRVAWSRSVLVSINSTEHLSG
jgi:hypothetical protein